MTDSLSPDRNLDELEEKMRVCQERIDYRFQNPDYLVAALTHASGAGTRLQSNERLEFLGDAILGMVVCDHLFNAYTDFLEGDLTKIKSVVVSRKTCARISHELKLEDCLMVGKGMQNTDKLPKSLLADVLESLIAAVYLDGGFGEAARFIGRVFFPEVLAAVAGELEGNYKSYLQQYSQREFHAAPIYRLVNQWGPDHSKMFLVAAEVGKRKFSAACGRNKKDAEQRAAQNALAEMKGDPPPNSSEPTKNTA